MVVMDDPEFFVLTLVTLCTFLNKSVVHHILRSRTVLFILYTPPAGLSRRLTSLGFVALS